MVLFMGKIARRGLKSLLALKGIIALVQVMAIIAGIKVSWDRYYLQIVLVLAISIGVFAGDAGARALRTVLKNRLDRSVISRLPSR